MNGFEFENKTVFLAENVSLVSERKVTIDLSDVVRVASLEVVKKIGVFAKSLTERDEFFGRHGE